MRLLTLPITDALAGRTVKNLLKRELQLSASLISHLKYRPNGITRNGQQVHTNEKVAAGDLLCVNIADDAPLLPPQDRSLAQLIVYEDEDLLVLNKPAGVEMHPREESPNIRSVRNMVCSYLGSGALFHPVNRLDADTSGLMVVAKNRYMCDRLRRLLHTEDFRREYLAICCGVPNNGSIIAEIQGAYARTDCTVLAQTAQFALTRLQLYTGRTHQIRIHLSSIGCPLLGDARYGSPSPLLARHALHSAAITLTHPLSGAALHLTAPPPADFAAAAEQLFGELQS